MINVDKEQATIDSEGEDYVLKDIFKYLEHMSVGHDMRLDQQGNIVTCTATLPNSSFNPMHDKFKRMEKDTLMQIAKECTIQKEQLQYRIEAITYLGVTEELQYDPWDINRPLGIHVPQEFELLKQSHCIIANIELIERFIQIFLQNKAAA